MWRLRTLASVVAIVGGTSMGLVQPGRAFECPEPQAQGVRGVVPEPQQEISELSSLLRSGDLENRLEVIARDLKRKHPDASKTELTNFMMTAYCPVIASDQSLGDSERAQRLERFSEQVWQIYGDLGM